jgi:hypothetical protein
MDSTNIIEISLHYSIITGAVAYFLFDSISKINKTPDAGCCKRPSSSHFAALLAYRAHDFIHGAY